MDQKKVLIIDINKYCTENAYFSACLRKFCERNNFRLTESCDEADIFVVNGCNIVRQGEEVAAALRKAARARTEIKVIAFGCTPPLKRVKGEKNFHVIPVRDIVRRPGDIGKAFGAKEPFRILPMNTALEGVNIPVPSIFSGIKHDYAHLKISEGCLGKCTYCAYKQAKGPLLSVPLEDILNEFDSLLAKGHSRFSLVSDDAVCWGRDLGSDLSVLLSRLVERAPSCEFITTSFNPNFLNAELLKRLEPFLANFAVITMPIQSGNNRILRLMKRGYTIEKVSGIVSRIRRRFEAIWLATDVIVGFPTETFPEFMDSVRAAGRFDSAVFLSFVPHPFTPAGEMAGQIPQKEILRRKAVVRNLAKKFKFIDVFPEKEYGKWESWLRKAKRRFS